MWFKNNYKYILLFVITFVTTTLSGVEWITGKSPITDGCDFVLGGNITWEHIERGMYFSIPFLLILTVHEFGHYFTAKYYKADVSLPFYIPMWFFGLSPSIGTMGAFIKIKSTLRTTKEFFDVGIAGPLAGFVVAIGFIWYGFATLPEVDYVYDIHPDYEEAYAEHGLGTDIVYSTEYQQKQYVKNALKCNSEAQVQPPESFEIFSLGDNLLFKFFKWAFSYQGVKIPNAYELFHYPFLFAGYLACFFTALNLIPIGQLDGGHVMYGLLGYERFNKISPYIYKAFMFHAGLGFITPDMLQEDLMFWLPGYLFFLNICFRRIHPELKERLIWAMGIFLTQYGVSYLFPALEGYSGYLFFGLVIGNFLGVYHPTSLVEVEIDAKRKVLGWLAIAILILCFPAQFFVL